ncbi:helix-turn-helix domain-containing protein [Flammeovirga sp. MY04]|uniref:helix-turn-helix domain-containing protein n=1 Tax=Flammeovirga sp. MY04 TaxID=1191459 RepID=UPI0008061B66|nr:helix-turn-helix domain-containing protein [Flammeovirga sp. MY04]ANQ52720.1 helix-turn-helix domain-containing protein [Flammeovirga sp. MY04]
MSYNNTQKIEVIINGTRMIIEDEDKIKSIKNIVLSDTAPEKLSTLITSQKAADILGMSRPTLIKLSDNGKLNYIRNGNRRMFKEQDVLNYKMDRENIGKKLNELSDLSNDLNLDV